MLSVLSDNGQERAVALLLSTEAAKRLRISERQLKYLRLSGQLTFIPGRPVRIDERDLDAYVEELRAKGEARRKADAQRKADADPSRESVAAAEAAARARFAKRQLVQRLKAGGKG